MRIISYHKNKIIALLLTQLFVSVTQGQNVYFVDGFHGGIYGHYPSQYTAFINDALEKNSSWNINLEIEPETWDSVKANEPANYATFKKYFEDQSDRGRMEYVNPSYGQAYLYNINGESIIRQFSYGMKKLRVHFPNAVFTTYSSEEPCFTSALPGILTSFGFRYASLKNPNTCWGGYTSAFGGESVNWIGPDGAAIKTIPRYAIEELEKTSTWTTTASRNSNDFIEQAFKYGIRNPVGMCLQDAGWHYGPWLGAKPKKYAATYITWRNYIKNIAAAPVQDWKFSQEDVRVSLVWGAQVLQQIARQTRVSENNMTQSEKIAVISNAYWKSTWPAGSFDEAWRTLLLAQHHDCWIVPYNGKKGDTWIDKVRNWTKNTDRIADSAISKSMLTLDEKNNVSGNYFIRIFNTGGAKRSEFVKIALPPDVDATSISIVDKNMQPLPLQLISKAGNNPVVLFKAGVPSMGFSTYQIINKNASTRKTNSVLQMNGKCIVENDLYKILIDPAKGGAITSLVAKKMGNKEFVKQHTGAGFNELKGYFFKDSSFFSSATEPARITIIEDGPLCSKVSIQGTINGQPFTQTITVLAGEPVIDLQVKIDWKGNRGIGKDYKQKSGYRAEDVQKAFYDDRYKLQTLFPLNLSNQKLYKNAPFDVTESKMDNTFFTRWDSIKNNVLLNWVDITDGKGKFGLALFSDHTTAYTHGKEDPLGLITQYSGVGLWGRNYSLNGPTEF